MAAFRNIFVVKWPSLLLLCVYKKSFIDWKIAVGDLKHACLSSPWVSCHVNVLYLAHRRPFAGWSSFEVRVINLSRSKLRVLRKVRKRKKVELFAPAQTKVSCLTNHNRQTNQWTGETSKCKCEAKCLGRKAQVEKSLKFISFCLWLVQRPWNVKPQTMILLSWQRRGIFNFTFLCFCFFCRCIIFVKATNFTSKRLWLQSVTISTLRSNVTTNLD